MSLCEVNSGLFGTCVSLDAIERGVRRGLRTTARCGSQRKVDLIGENQGFFSRVGLLHCNWPDGSSLPNKVVVKITTLLNTIAMHQRTGSKKKLMGEAAKKEKNSWMSKATKLRKWHNNEVNFYKHSKKLDFHSVPQMYYALEFDEENTGNGYICMEFAHGSICSQVYEFLSADQIKEVMRSMAEMQCKMSTINEEQKKQFTVNAYEDLFGDIIQPDVLGFRLEELRDFSGELSDSIDKVTPLLRKISNIRPSKWDCSELGIVPVFVHGDLYTPNLLWKLNENGNLELDKIIDWQLCHFGSPAEDITRLILSSMRPGDRKESVDGILKEYFNHISAIWVSPLFTFEQLETTFNNFFTISALAFIGTIFEVFTASQNTCPKDHLAARKRVIVQKVKSILEEIHERNQ